MKVILVLLFIVLLTEGRMGRDFSNEKTLSVSSWKGLSTKFTKGRSMKRSKLREFVLHHILLLIAFY